jgi:hypothetical protein
VSGSGDVCCACACCQPRFEDAAPAAAAASSRLRSASVSPDGCCWPSLELAAPLGGLGGTCRALLPLLCQSVPGLRPDEDAAYCRLRSVGAPLAPPPGFESGRGCAAAPPVERPAGISALCLQLLEARAVLPCDWFAALCCAARCRQRRHVCDELLVALRAAPTSHGWGSCGRSLGAQLLRRCWHRRVRPCLDSRKGCPRWAQSAPGGAGGGGADRRAVPLV